MTRLAIIRHGVTAWNKAGKIQGRTDIPLTEEAVRDLSNMRLPKPWSEAALWSSPLSRATQTAKLITGRAPLISDHLIEMNWGDWEGKQGAELKADRNSGFRDIENWGWKYTPPDGECPADVAERLATYVDGLTEDAVAVCHIGVMRVLLAQAYNWAFDGSCPFAIKRNRLYVLTRTETGWHKDVEVLRLEEAVQ